MIITLRGCSGSGKSYPVYRLREEFGPGADIWWPPMNPPNNNKHAKKLVGHVLGGGLFLVGSYNTAQCGGADTIHGGFPKVHLPFIERAAKKYPFVIYEALMGACSRVDLWLELEQRLELEAALAGAPLSAGSIVHLTLDTPMEVCKERVDARRARSNRAGTPYNVGATINANYRRTHRKHAELLAAGADTRMIDYTKSYEALKAVLEEAGWKP